MKTGGEAMLNTIALIRNPPGLGAGIRGFAEAD
jgi:hypothetical protein